MKCEDPLVKWFRNQGFCLVRHPRDDLQPLLLLEGDKRTVLRIGPLAAEIDHHGDLPTQRRTRVRLGAVDRTGELRSSVAIPVLQGILAAMGASPKAALAYRASQSLRVNVSDVEEVGVELGDLYRFLDAGVRFHGSTVAELAARDRLFIVTASLWARQINVVVTRGNAHAATLEDPVLHGDVEVKYDATTGTRISYRGTSRLAFAFKAVQLVCENGRVRARTVAGTELKAVAGAGVPPALLRTDDDLVDLEEQVPEQRALLR